MSDVQDNGRDPAFARFVTIQVMRVAGVVMFLYGILAMNGRAPWPDGVPVEWAMALAIVGAVDAFLVPIFLSRMWSSAKK